MQKTRKRSSFFSPFISVFDFFTISVWFFLLRRFPDKEKMTISVE